jgi:hypothetical protein
VRAAQTELQIEDEKIRRQPMPPLQKPLVILDASPARTAHDDHFVCGEIAEPQPPIPLSIKAAAAMIDGFALACTDPAKHGQAWGHFDDTEIS